MPRQSKPWFRASKGTWYVTLGGRKVSLGVSGRANKRAAVEAWHRLIAVGPAPKPEPEPKAGATVQAVVDAFLADAKGRVRPVIMQFYERFCRFFAAENGALPADALTLTQVEAWARKPTWGSSTRHDALGILATAFRWAERAGMIGSNPLQGLRKPPKASRGAKAVISAEEHARLCAHADPPFRAFLQLLWLTGARPGEVAALRAEQVDHAQGVAVLSEHKTAHLGKSRVLFLSPEALAVIRGLGRAEGLLFPGEAGQPMTAQAIGKRLRRLCVKAGVRNCTPYGYRHSFASDALAKGVPDAQVAALMGHASTAMLHRHYSHLTARAQALRTALASVR